MTCRCPHLPVLDRGSAVGSSVLCTCCGTPLRLTCDGCEGEKPAGIPAVVSHGPETPTPVAEVAREKRPRTYAPKPCDGCGNQFQPTGPRHTTGPCCRPRGGVP